MTWFRAQDDIAENTKTGQLTDGQFRTWIRVLGYASRARTAGLLDTRVLRKNVPRTTRVFVEKCLELRLVDRVENCPNLVQIHNWHKYSPNDPTGAERARRYREKHAEEEAEQAEKRNGFRNGKDRDDSNGLSNGEVTVPSCARDTKRYIAQDRGLSSERPRPRPEPSELDQPHTTNPTPEPRPPSKNGLGTGGGINNLTPLGGSVRDQLDQLAKENAP